MMSPRFRRPKGSRSEATPNLYVANCGPAVGISFDDIKSVFGNFGKIVEVHAADESGSRVIVCFSEVSSAQEAFEVLNGCPCPDLGGRTMHMRYSVLQLTQKALTDGTPPVCFLASELAIPGIYLVHDFITLEEEQELLAEVDSRQWENLSKRRVQHYGYEFLYKTRNVDSKQFLGELPAFVSNILQKILSFPGLDSDRSKEMDQLTVNEYPSGVGLSPHIDTHSAFEELIFSLSTAGSCVMEFRRYPEESWHITAASVTETHENNTHLSLNITRKAIFLPPRSMLLMSGEGRHAWHHYIPHHKVDVVGEKEIRRSSRRVSFTFRKVCLYLLGRDHAAVRTSNTVILNWKVRKGSCCYVYKQYCDSQLECREQVKQIQYHLNYAREKRR